MDSKTEKFLQKIKDKGYWNDNLDYSKGVYTGIGNTFELWCKIHKIEVTKKSAKELYSYKGCQLCGYEESAKKNRINGINNFLKVAPVKFKYQFTYDQDFSKSLGEDMEIYCNKHDEKFLQKPNAHLKGTTKCSGCRKEKLENQRARIRMSLGEFIKKATKKHNGEYSYKNVVQFKNQNDIVTITCKEHGDVEVHVGNHLGGSGCPFCAGNKKRTTKSFLKELKEKDLLFKGYDYSLVDYKNKGEKVIVIDEKFNSRHLLFPSALLNGTKCQGINLEEGYWKFLKARDFVRNLKLKSNDDWKEYCNTGEKTHYIPSDVAKEYKNDKDWLSIPDFIGYKIGYKYLDFLKWDDALEHVHALNLKSQGEWFEYVKSGKLPHNIPSNPKHYSEFTSYSHWLGYLGEKDTVWTKQAILSFINNIKGELIKLDSIELITIINSNNLAKKIKDLGFLEDLVSSKSNTTQRESVVSKIQKHISDLVGNSDEEELIEEDFVENIFEEELTEGDDTFYDSVEEVEELKDFKPLEELKFYDNKLITSSLDDENIDFLLKNQLKKLWNSVLNNEIEVDEILKENGGKNFRLIKDMFINEYQEVSKIALPQNYVFKYPPNLMQKLVTYRMKQEKLYGNWSGTGAGKTLSSILCGRYIGLNNTIIICNNSTISGWVNSIHEYFDNSYVYTKTELNNKDVEPSKYNIVHKYDINLEKDRFNYIVLNYETFQLEDGEFIVSKLLKNNTIDYVILDEVQNVKQRSEKDESSRRNVVNKLIIHSKNENPNLHLMVMSATPVINNLVEPKKLIELISGEVHEELDTKSSISNGIEMYKSLTRFGIRYKPKYGITVNENLIQVNGDDLVESLKKVPKGSPIGFEKVLINTKLESIKPYLKKGTLIYSHYVTDLVKEIGKFVSELGFSFGFYIGDDKEGLRRFKNKEIDILIGSSPVGTGVDGIQYVCNTLIPLILPWTSSEYEQLLGRVNRQGSSFDNVNVFIPQVVVSREEKEWSWDKRRYNIIKFKSTLADLSMDGIIPKELSPPKSTLVKQAQKELEEWINRISEDDILTIDREEIKIPLNPKQIERKRKQLGNFSELNKTWSISRSENTFKRLKKDKSEWCYYHTLYSEKRREWDEIPYEEIAKKIKKGDPDWIIADMGCGENLLSKEIENKVHSFDYVACEGEDVTACDMSNVPMDDQQVNAVVFSLSLMGSNNVDYLKEGFRILKPYGMLFICEPKKKAENRLEKLKKEIEDIGFRIVEVKPSSQFMYINAVKI